MGTTSFKQSEYSSDFQERKTATDSASYILGKHSSILREKPTDPPINSNNSVENALSFIPNPKPPWNLRSASPLRTPILSNPRKRTVTTKRFTSLNQHKPDFDRLPRIMSAQDRFKCDQCGIVFPSNEALFKHKTRFCIGVKDSGIGRDPIYSDDEDKVDNKTPRRDNGYTRKSPVKIVVHHPTPRKKVTGRLCFYFRNFLKFCS